MGSEAIMVLALRRHPSQPRLANRPCCTGRGGSRRMTVLLTGKPVPTFPEALSLGRASDRKTGAHFSGSSFYLSCFSSENRCPLFREHSGFATSPALPPRTVIPAKAGIHASFAKAWQMFRAAAMGQQASTGVDGGLRRHDGRR